MSWPIPRKWQTSIIIVRVSKAKMTKIRIFLENHHLFGQYVYVPIEWENQGNQLAPLVLYYLYNTLYIISFTL